MNYKAEATLRKEVSVTGVLMHSEEKLTFQHLKSLKIQGHGISSSKGKGPGSLALTGPILIVAKFTVLMFIGGRQTGCAARFSRS